MVEDNGAISKIRQSKYGTNIYRGSDDSFVIQKSVNNHLKIFGVFDSLKFAKFVREILANNDWDVDYFIKNNIFIIEGHYCLFKLIRSKITLVGVFSSFQEAKEANDNFDYSSILEHREKFVYKFNNKFHVQRSFDELGTFIAKVSSLELALAIRDFLEKNEWDIDIFNHLNNILPIEGKYYVFSYQNLKLFILDEFDDKKDAMDNKDDLISNFERNNSNVPRKKGDRFIHSTPKGYAILNRIDGILTLFGTFDTKEEAIARRDELIEKNWDVENVSFNDYMESDQLNEAIFRLTPWQKVVFDAINKLNSDFFMLEDLKQFESTFKRFVPSDKIENKLLSNLEDLMDLGLITKITDDIYEKHWDY